MDLNIYFQETKQKYPGNPFVCNPVCDRRIILKAKQELAKLTSCRLRYLQRKTLQEILKQKDFSFCFENNSANFFFIFLFLNENTFKSRKENPQKLTQLSSRSHPRHLVGKRTAQKDITIDTTNDSQVNSNFPNRWSPASLTFNNYFYLFLYL